MITRLDLIRLLSTFIILEIFFYSLNLITFIFFLLFHQLKAAQVGDEKTTFWEIWKLVFWPSHFILKRNFFNFIYSNYFFWPGWNFTYETSSRCPTSIYHVFMNHSLCPYQILQILLSGHLKRREKKNKSDLINLKKCEIVSIHSSHVMLLLPLTEHFLLTVLRGRLY